MDFTFDETPDVFAEDGQTSPTGEGQTSPTGDGQTFPTGEGQTVTGDNPKLKYALMREVLSKPIDLDEAAERYGVSVSFIHNFMKQVYSLDDLAAAKLAAEE
jgi:hypothetical protein